MLQTFLPQQINKLTDKLLQDVKNMEFKNISVSSRQEMKGVASANAPVAGDLVLISMLCCYINPSEQLSETSTSLMRIN